MVLRANRMGTIARIAAAQAVYVSPLILLGGSDSSFFEVGSHLADKGFLGFRLRPGRLLRPTSAA